MFQRALRTIGVLCLAIGSSPGGFAQEIDEPLPFAKPNIIYIIVDDLGIGDITPFGQKVIKTPNLQSLADNGIIFTQHYSGSTICAPSRASLMTGLHTGHTQIRGNFALGGYTNDVEYGQMALHPGTQTIATVLRKAGYSTGLIGKWALGGPGSYGMPTKQGFDYFFGYLDQKQAHNHYPTHLWLGAVRFTLNNEWLHPHQSLPDGLDPKDPANYESYMREDFAQQRLTDDALRFIDDNSDRPFFLKLAYAGPHAALQAPEEEINEFNFEETPYLGKSDGKYVPQRRPRAARAAMITNIDDGVGKIVALLKSLGIHNNTLIMFTSDNGPSFEGGADLAFFDSNGPFRGFKRDLYEGGIRMPTIAHWPDEIAPGSATNHVSAFWDVLPTFADIAGQELISKTNGISFLPSLLGNNNQEKHASLYWEFHHWNGDHAQAVRFTHLQNDSWKAVRTYDKKHRVNPPIELYNLQDDQQESNDLALQFPELVVKAAKLMDESRSPSFIDAWNFDYWRGK